MNINDKVKVKIKNKYWVQGKVLKIIEGDIDYICVEVPAYYTTQPMTLHLEVPVAEVMKN